MTTEFKILKLFEHHNRGQFIVARQLDFKEPLLIEEGSLLDGIPVFHYLEMYPFSREEDPQFDVYVLRPTELKGYPKGFFQEGQVVRLYRIDNVGMTLQTFENEIKEAILRLLEMARSQTRNEISDNYKLILTEIKDNSENLQEQRKINKLVNDEKVPMALIELMPTLKKLYPNFYDINLYIYKATRSITIVDFRYYPKSSLDEDFRMKVLDDPPTLHCKVTHPPWLSDKREKFDINWEHYEGLNGLRLLWLKLKLRT